MDLNRIATFARVVEQGSFTAAAKALGVPKSSVSRSVAALEGELGVRLIQRTTRKLHLTDAGQAYFAGVRPAVAGIDEATAAVGEMGNEPRGAVRITAPFDMSEVLPDMLARFCKRHPHVQVEVCLTGRHVDLVQEGFDLAVRAGKLADSSLVVRKVADAELGLYASPAYLKRRGRPRRLADLATHDCVLMRATHGRATFRMTGPDGEESVEVSARVSTDEMWFAYRGVLAGLGIALLPTALSAREPAGRGGLVRVLPEYKITGGGLYVALPSGRFVPARVALLRDFLVDELRTLLQTCTQDKGRRSKARPA